MSRHYKWEYDSDISTEDWDLFIDDDGNNFENIGIKDLRVSMYGTVDALVDHVESTDTELYNWRDEVTFHDNFVDLVKEFAAAVRKDFKMVLLFDKKLRVFQLYTVVYNSSFLRSIPSITKINGDIKMHDPNGDGMLYKDIQKEVEHE